MSEKKAPKPDIQATIERMSECLGSRQVLAELICFFEEEFWPDYREKLEREVSTLSNESRGHIKTALFSGLITGVVISTEAEKEGIDFVRGESLM